MVHNTTQNSTDRSPSYIQKTIIAQNFRIDWARFNIPTITLWVISGTGFYRSNDPTNSVKAL